MDCKFYKTWNCSNPDAKEICEQYKLREKIETEINNKL